MSREIVAPPHMRDLVTGLRYAPAVRIGDELHVSGQVGRDERMAVVAGSLEDHIAAAFDNLGAVVAAAGGSLADVYELTTYHVDIAAQMPVFAAVKQRYFGDPATLPAWTAVGVTALASPDFLVEIAARAHLA
ncbi:RidA family protein [Microbacterium sp. cf332]|uniref:RidA family protein n=1 Tax=Microbacterium sp. cf332 TaxID=1761804 RepID=UPI00088223CE|nr:RidA family protein [Microbacterium sp. cf332]SDQ94561.1 Enamine deaminase RidA, house cleaning of reactive enamine intermediates, YjgF/YER057c/UK114 family [Microbacterium sp. cf332]